MSRQPLLWDASVALPVSGESPEARHAGSTGAQMAAKSRGQVSAQYLQLLTSIGPLSDHEAAKMLGREVSSINSVRNGCGLKVTASGQFEQTHWGTKRVRWMLARAGSR